jgi:CheY-like chemotaxis protein
VTVIDTSAPATIHTDQQRLEQILRNLLSNSFKFTNEGEVHLSVRRAEADTIEFSVADSGIGISEDMQELIFEPFHQIDAASNRKYGGAGLGLSISRDLARLLGGTLSVASESGHGSVFTLRIPVGERSTGIVDPAPDPKLAWEFRSLPDENVEPNEAAAQRVDISSANFDGRTILIVDDDVRNIFALTSVLEGRGAKIVTGRNGLDAIQRINEEGAIDLVLMDIMMPEMDGYEAIEKIRADQRFKELPIIAITAKSTREDREKCLQVGASDYAPKPLNIDHLISMISERLPQEEYF